MKDRIVILGGNGFLGYHLAALCKKKKIDLVIFDSKFDKQKKIENIKYVKGNILNRKKILRLIKKNDIVYHFAAIADIDEANNNFLKSIDVNINGTVNVLEACIKKKAKKIIYSSSIYARSEQGGIYSTTKLASEMLIERYSSKFNLKYTIIRFGSLYGEKSNYFNTIKNLIKQGISKKKIIRNTRGNEIRNYIHIKDAVAICLNLVSQKYNNKYFNLIGKEKKSMREVVKIIGKELGIKNIKFKNNPNDYDHYIINPYTYKTRVGKIIKPKKPYKFKNSIRMLIREERKLLKNIL